MRLFPSFPSSLLILSPKGVPCPPPSPPPPLPSATFQGGRKNPSQSWNQTGTEKKGEKRRRINLSLSSFLRLAFATRHFFPPNHYLFQTAKNKDAKGEVKIERSRKEASSSTFASHLVLDADAACRLSSSFCCDFERRRRQATTKATCMRGARESATEDEEEEGGRKRRERKFSLSVGPKSPKRERARASLSSFFLRCNFSRPALLSFPFPLLLLVTFLPGKGEATSLTPPTLCLPLPSFLLFDFWPPFPPSVRSVLALSLANAGQIPSIFRWGSAGLEDLSFFSPMPFNL